jgi:hypothetical protein
VTPISAAPYKAELGKKLMGLAKLMRRLELGEEHTLVFETAVEYRTVLLSMDAKEFGVPQTRTRNYMLIYRPATWTRARALPRTRCLPCCLCGARACWLYVRVCCAALCLLRLISPCHPCQA